MIPRDDGGGDVEVSTRAVQTPETSVGIQALVLSGKAKGTSVRIGERLRIGKAPDNELVLLDDTVSRHHCELLRADGLPEAICRFASHHTGVGLSRADVLAQRLPIPPADYLAETGEERLVMYADKFHSKTTPPVFRTASASAARLRRFGEEKVMAFEALRETFGEPDLAALSKTYGDRVVGEA